MEKVVIKNIDALEILDSRGDPTIEVSVTLSNGVVATASGPSGVSTGMYEAFELRDGDRHRFGGKGVTKAVRHVRTEIRDEVVGRDPFDQKLLDAMMIKLDGTEE